MVSAKWPYHKERSFASNYFIFLKVLFQFKNLFGFFVSAGVLFDDAFSLRVSLKGWCVMPIIFSFLKQLLQKAEKYWYKGQHLHEIC